MKKHEPQKNDGGFTLIELAMVMIIMGLIAGPLIQYYALYYQNKMRQDTLDNIEADKAEISFFFNNTVRYPCPSDRALPITDPNFGREFHVTCDPTAVGLVAPNTCTASGGICLVAGNRDLSNPPDGDMTDANELIIIGGIPIASLRDTNLNQISNELAVDSWGNKLTYAVSHSLTTTATYKFNEGQIKAVDEFGADTAGINNDAHYVLISHGKNGKGAFRATGTTIPFACGSSLGIDDENCDNDGTFMSALGQYEGNTANYFDDYTYFMVNKSSSIWAFIPSTGHLYNLNSGNVGVNTTAPGDKLDVSGTLRANNNVKAAQICKKTGGGCFPISAITGDTTDMRCPAGEVMIGISLSHAQCQVPAFTVPVNVDCSPFWVHGVTSKGCVICTDGTYHCP